MIFWVCCFVNAHKKNDTVTGPYRLIRNLKYEIFISHPQTKILLLETAEREITVEEVLADIIKKYYIGSVSGRLIRNLIRRFIHPHVYNIKAMDLFIALIYI